MRTVKSKIITVEHIEDIVCSKCKKIISHNNTMEFNNAFIFDQFCGYGSIFGDGNKIEIELCEDCFKELLGEYITTKEL